MFVSSPALGPFLWGDADPLLGRFGLFLLWRRRDVYGVLESMAFTEVRPHGDWYHSITKLWHEHGDHAPDGLFSWDASTERETIIFGSPASVREQMARFLEVSGCNYVACSFAWGSFTHEQMLHSLHLFSEEVMPAFSGSVAPLGLI